MAIDLLYLNQDDVVKAGVTDMGRCIDVMEEMFTLMGQGDYLMGGYARNSHGMEIFPPESSPFPNMPVEGPDRRFMAMPGYLGGRFHMAGLKWYGSNRENIKKGLPRSILMVCLNDPDTGAPLAYMSGNLISSMRTGAVPGVGVRLLANEDAAVVAVIGCGVINRTCLAAILCARSSIRKVQIYDLFPAAAQSMVEYINRTHPGVEAQVCDSIENAVRNADVVTVATSGANPPVIDDAWLKDGVLLSLPAEVKLPKEFVLKTRKIIDNKRMHQLWEEECKGVGDFHTTVGILSSYLVEYVNQGEMSWDDVTNIGDILAGKAVGRKDKKEKILFIMGGMPIEDIAWGTEVYNKALEMGLGTRLHLWDEPYKL
ncbi:MAG: tyramine oxidase subunit B [Pygmaiobacter massiliensis]|nr:tyramine oxidase subunit B [Pygmaiobacter massiliensis]